MELEQADAAITATEWRDAIELISSTRVRVTALDRLQGVTPEMIDWWFANMDRAGYIEFHPVDHEDFAWVRGKEPDRYVGATHLTHQTYGGTGPLMRAEISFIPPDELLDTSLLAAHDVGVAICAVVHLRNEAGEVLPDEAARFSHVGLGREWGTELRSCWWLNTTPESDIDWLTTRRLQHVHEEFGYLQGFLPERYAQRTLA
jgi:hypothetical protein